MVKILMEHLKFNDRWIPVAIGFSGDVENIAENYALYHAYTPPKKETKRKFKSKKNTPEYFLQNVHETYIMTQIRKRGDTGIFSSPIRVDWGTRVVEIDGNQIAYEEFQKQISTGDIFKTPYNIQYWGEHADEGWNSFGVPHITIRIGDLVHYWGQFNLRL